MDVIEAFKLQREAARIFSVLIPYDYPHIPSICKCLITPFATLKRTKVGPTLRKSLEARYAHFCGLQTCKSVWVCPICSCRISEFRRKEIIELIVRVKDAGFHFFFVTFTLPHTNLERCRAVLKRFMMARRRLTSSKRFRALGFVGWVTKKEVTYGKNGWHPHSHDLIVTDKFLSVQYLKFLKSELKFLWCRALKVPMSSALYRRACVVEIPDGKNNMGLAVYLTKGVWSGVEELTKEQMKKTQKGNLSPFGLLRLSRFQNLGYDSPVQAASLFMEYAAAFKGCRSLGFSASLKRRFLIKDVKDDEIIDDEMSDFYGALSGDQFWLIVEKKLRGWLIKNTEKLSFNDLLVELNRKILE